MSSVNADNLRCDQVLLYLALKQTVYCKLLVLGILRIRTVVYATAFICMLIYFVLFNCLYCYLSLMPYVLLCLCLAAFSTSHPKRLQWSHLSDG